ncbi:16S rRNA (uracil(1498)-N(3))-methyltransferase [bacterium]|nr:16S rRNA (uracil(1498)-N(3))-methyltransferase [bacterium]
MSRHLVNEIPPVGEDIVLPRSERRHIERVLRLVDGDTIVVFDGRGSAADALLTHAGNDNLVARIVRRHPPLPPPFPELTMIVAAMRGERLESTIEKLTELGAARIVLFEAERTQRRLLLGRSARRVAAAVAAAKQCGRDLLPEIKEVSDIALAVSEAPAVAIRWLADPNGDAPLVPATAADSVAIVIGPEGGLTDDESAIAHAAGFAPVRLSDAILRSDTAAIVAAGLAMMAGGRR